MIVFLAHWRAQFVIIEPAIGAGGGGGGGQERGRPKLISRRLAGKLWAGPVQWSVGPNVSAASWPGAPHKVAPSRAGRRWRMIYGRRPEGGRRRLAAHLAAGRRASLEGWGASEPAGARRAAQSELSVRFGLSALLGAG